MFLYGVVRSFFIQFLSVPHNIFHIPHKLFSISVSSIP
ncbi:hypothetical protein JCM19300_403 [Algibacter lectus]|uniref:Uncharacterized protein n=1 Tax=Algibacter lectus TaxID=221126 RepID=A0A090VK45_9FLAO|nr:hypothetical protein JCM19300_403 [Algibacter lectus]